MISRKIITVLLFLILPGATPAQPNSAIKSSVDSFLSSLSDSQKKKCSFAIDDEERYNWNFVPTSRKGIAFRELSKSQQGLFMKILRLALSDQGYQKASSIMQLEAILKELEGHPASSDYRDPGKYYFSVFGNPSPEKVWGWRIEGHHLALNFLYNKNEAAALPSFFGSNPAIVPSGSEKGKQILKQEVEKAFGLLNSFSADQQAVSVISDRAFPEIITGNDRKVNPGKPQGLSYSKMNSAQQKLFRELVAVYIVNYSKEIADELMKEIEAAGYDQLYFAWAGAKKWGEGHYYRIQGPTLWIEYDNTQTNANHVHTSIRSLKNDFGEDLLKKHYALEH